MKFLNEIGLSYTKGALFVFGLFINLSFSMGQCNPSTITLNTPENGSPTHVASEEVVILPDYSFDSQQGNAEYYVKKNCIEYSGFHSDQDMEADINESLPVGSINGEHGVGPNGEAQYQVSIDLPKGVNDMEPTLSLNYNSVAPNGVLGKGWNLSVSSVIMQTTKNWYFDKDSQSIKLDGSGKFQIDGERIFALNGGYGADGTVHGTELESYRQIISKGTGSLPNYFIVKDKNGLTREYGVSNDSKILSNDGDPISYGLSKIYDRHGNYIKYEYFNDNTLRIRKISYTSNDNENIQASNYIKFSYAERQDKNTIYLAGTGIHSNVLLDEISIFSDHKLVKEYLMSYGENLNSYLTALTCKSYEGKEMNSTLFQYGSHSTFALESTSSFVGITNGSGLTSADLVKGQDFNGDGLDDVLAKFWEYQGNTKVYTSWKAYTSNGDNTFSEFSSGVIPPGYVMYYDDELPLSGQASTFDFDGNGTSDIFLIAYSGNPNQLTLNELLIQKIDHNGQVNTYNVPFSTGGWYDPENSVQIGDFDGDGRQDILLFRRNSSYVYSGKIITQHSGEQNLDLTGLQYLNAAEDVQVVDFDGDKKNDILVIYPNSAEIFEFKPESGGTYEEERIYYSANPGFPTKYHTIYQGDFNGDGKTDLLTSGDNEDWYIAYSTGKGYIEKEFNFLRNYDAESNDHFITIADLNFDGKSDIIHISQNGIQSSYLDLYHSNGVKFEYDTEEISYITSLDDIFSGDFNGDGKKSLFNRDYFASPAHIYTFNKNGREDLLTKVRDGFGNQVEFNYLKSTQDDDYTDLITPGTGPTFPIISYQVSVPVVKSVVKPDGIGGDHMVEYEYHGSRIHIGGKGFFGFMRVCSNDLTSNVKGTTDYSLYTSPNHPHFFAKILDESFSENTLTNQLISKSENTYDIIHLDQYRYKAQLSEIINTDYVSNKSNSVEKFYDNNGNIILTRTINTAETLLEYSEFSSEGWWIPSYLTRERLLNVRNSENHERIIEYDYNDANGDMISEVTDPQTAFERNMSFYYDNLGNLIRETVSSSGLPSMLTKYEYDSRGVYLIKKTDALNTVKTYVLNTRLGRISKIYEDGYQIYSFDYDSFGKMLSSENERGVVAVMESQWAVSNNNNSIKEPINTLYKEVKTIEGQPKEVKWYDILGREVMKMVEGPSGDIYSVEKFNSKGESISVTQPFYGSETPKVKSTNYDNYGREVNSTDGLNVINYSYEVQNSLYKIIVEKDGIIKTSYLDASDKRVKIDNVSGTISYSYHPSGELKETIVNGELVSFQEYDLIGNKIKQVEINSGETIYEYDAYNNLLSYTDSRGEQTTYQYDNVSRLISETTSEGTTTYEYSQGRNKEVLKTIVHPNGTITENEIDLYGQITEKSITYNGETFAFTNLYNLFGDIIEKTYPSGIVIKTTYDNKGYVEKVTNESGTVSYFSQAEYDSKGNIIDFYLGNGLEVSKTFDDYGKLTSIFTNGVQDYELTWNQSEGTIAKRTDYLVNREENFEYDSHQRLIESKVSLLNSNLALPAYTTSYEPNGNIESKSDAGSQYTYDSEKIHAVVQIDDPTQNIPSFDQQITFNQKGYVSNITENNLNYTIDYRPNGDRINSRLYDNGSLVKEIYYLGLYEKEIDNGGNIKEINYVFTPAGVTSALITENGNTSLFYLHRDHLNSIVALTDEQGDVVYEQNFDAWGNKRNPATWGFNNMSSNSDFSWVRGFTGHEHVDEFGLINMNHRFYDPVLGRMLGPDNYVADNTNTQSFNRYTYANNNPLIYTDPNGDLALAFFTIGFATVGSVIGGAVDDWRLRGFLYGGYVGAKIGLTVASVTSLFSGSNIRSGFRSEKSFSKGPLFKWSERLPNAVSILHNIITTSMFNQGSYLVKTVMSNEEFNRKEFFESAFIGATAGAIGGLAGLVKEGGNRSLSVKGLKKMSYVTNIFNGAALRFNRARYLDETPTNTARHTIFGAVEGAMSSFMLTNSDMPMQTTKDGLYVSGPQTLLTTGVGTFVTGIPGLASMLFTFYAPMYKGNLFNYKAFNSKGALFVGGFVSLPLGLLGEHESGMTSYPTTIPIKNKSFEIRPYFINSLFGL